MADDKPTVVEAWAAVMEEVRAVGKSDTNSQQGYRFRGIDAVVNAVGPVLRRHGIVPMPMLQKATYRDVLTSTGKPSRECTVEVLYRFYGPAGDYIEAITPGESMDFGDKGAPKAMSVAYRIVLLQALCLPTDEADPDSTSYERADSPALPDVELVREEVLSADVTYSRLQELWRTAKPVHRATVLDTEGQPTTVKALIESRAAGLTPDQTP